MVNGFLRGFVTAAVELEVGIKAMTFVLDASDARGMLTDARISLVWIREFFSCCGSLISCLCCHGLHNITNGILAHANFRVPDVGRFRSMYHG